MCKHVEQTFSYLKQWAIDFYYFARSRHECDETRRVTIFSPHQAEYTQVVLQHTI